MARYLSTLIAIIVSTLAATETPANNMRLIALFPDVSYLQDGPHNVNYNYQSINRSY